MHCKLSSILALAVFAYNCDVCRCIFRLFSLSTLDRFPGSDRMKALPFLGIFTFALRWHQAKCVVQFVAAELVFKSGMTLLFHIWTG